MSSTFISNMNAGNVSHPLGLSDITAVSTSGVTETLLATVTIAPEVFQEPGEMITWKGILKADVVTPGSFTIKVKSNSLDGLLLTTNLQTSRGGAWEVRMIRKDASNCIQLVQAGIGVYQEPQTMIRAIGDTVPVTLELFATVNNTANSITAVQNILQQP